MIVSIFTKLLLFYFFGSYKIVYMYILSRKWDRKVENLSRKAKSKKEYDFTEKNVHKCNIFWLNVEKKKIHIDYT